jgi:hypothetical protein
LGDETDMNYIREINAFYDWLETNTISDSAISLWHALMHINNKTGWKNEFTVALSVLESKTGLKKDALIRARKTLQKTNRISFKSRTGMQSAVYKIMPLELYGNGTSENCVVLNEAKCDTNHNANRAQTATQTTTQTASITKPNKTKLNDIYTPEFEKWYSEYPRTQSKRDSFKNFEKVRKEHGLEIINRCTQNYIAHYNSLPEDKKEFAYASNNFFGEKAYYEEFMEAKSKKKTHEDLMIELGFDGCDVT